MRPALSCLLLWLLLLPAQAQLDTALAAARRAAAPFVDVSPPPRFNLLPARKNTALGCDLVAGLPLAQALDAYRISFPNVAGDFAVYTTVDGALTQLCDARVPNLGAGLIPAAGDPTAAPMDAETGCWLRASQDGRNVRAAPRGAPVTKLDRLQQHPALGRNEAGDWLFYREGWVKRSGLLLRGNCDDLPLLDPAQVASGVIHYCPAGYAGFLPPRIGIGRKSARSASSDFANRLRAEPTASAELLAEIPPRQILEAVLDGPACQGSYIWWQVAVNGTVGWTIESDSNANFYYLEPYQAPSLRPLTPRNQPNGRGNGEQIDNTAERIDTLTLLEIEQPSGVAFSPDGSLLAVGGAAGARWFKFPPFGDYPHMPAADWLVEPIHALAWSHAEDKLAVVRGSELLVWKLDTSRLRPAHVELETGKQSLHFRHPYPLRSIAFSRDDRWLSVSGMSASGRYGALWVYDQSGALALSLPLAGAGLPPVVVPAPDERFGDFVYSSADKLYELTVENGHSRAFYQLAGTALRSLAFAPGSPDGTLLALALESEGVGWTALVDAGNAEAPGRTLRLDASDLAFSHDRRFLAVATQGRVFVLGTIA